MAAVPKHIQAGSQTADVHSHNGRRPRPLVETCFDVLLSIDGSGIITSVSPSLTPALGYEPEDVVGSHARELLHPNELRLLQGVLDALAQAPGKSLRTAYRLRHRNGAWRWFEGSATQMGHASGEGSIVMHLRDITEQTLAPRSAWDEMSEREHFVQFYETDAFLLDSLSGYIGTGLAAGEACIVVATPSHREGLDARLEAAGIVDLAAARARDEYVALDAAETLARFMVDGLPDPQRFAQEMESVIGRAAHSGRRVRIFGEMVALLWAEGNHAAAIRLEALWNELSSTCGVLHPFTLCCAYPIQDFAGEAYGAPLAQICAHHTRVIPDESYSALASPDERLRVITLLQQRARSLENEIAQRKAAQEAKIQALEAANRRMNEFLSIASHELRTPLTTLKANLQILARHGRKVDGGNGAGDSTCLDRCERQVERLARLIEDMIDLSRIREGRLELRPEACDLATIVREEVEMQRQAHPERVIELEMTECAALPIWADPDRIGQVVTNYLTNALKYSEQIQPVAVRVETEAGGHAVRVRVRDEGPGLPPRERERVWELFHRVPGVEVRSGSGVGLGLGLHIARTIVQRHGGQVGVVSQVGKGSTFWFSLPLVDANADAPAASALSRLLDPA